MERKKLPIGIDSFEKLRTEDFYYVDKTNLIGDLLNGWSEVNLFTRPRRFGKTLNMSMLKSFFEIGTDSALFNGLAIATKTKLCNDYLGKYPVVFISLKGVDGLTFAQACVGMKKIIRDEAKRLRFLLNSAQLENDEKEILQTLIQPSKDDAISPSALKELTDLLYIHYGQKVILLIDEYDVPLDKAYQHGYYNEMLNLIRSMFSAALKTNDSLHFAVLTGCLRISKESIFTGLNNLKVHSISDSQFDEYFGFTDAEVQKLLCDYDLNEHATEIKEWYNGYRFGEQDVYCPWDVINYCYDLLANPKVKPQAYWLNTSGNDTVRRLIDKADTGMIQSEIEDLIAGQSIRKKLNERLTHNEVHQNIDHIWSLLFMTGYLTMTANPHISTYDLVIPNQEVRQIYIDQVRSWFRDKTATETETLSALYKAFEEGNNVQIKEILDDHLLNTISFYDAHESFYHGFLLALLSSCIMWSTKSNAETGKGRSDIIVERKDRKLGFVIEVKDVKDERKLDTACKMAIRQIEEKDYTAMLRKYRVKDIWIYGIAFCDKECHVIAKHLI